MIMKIFTTIKKNISNFFKDIINLTNFFLKKKNTFICFFNENKHTIKYLEYFLNKKCRRKKVVLITFKEIDFKNSNCIILHLRSNFFREFFFLTANYKYLYSTTPNLNSSIFKKSVRSKIKYVYIQHSPISLLKAYHKKAFLDFDAVQAINSYQHREVSILNKLHKKNIKAFKSKYYFIENIKKQNKVKIDVLIAPTWKTNFYELKYHYILDDLFKKNNIDYILRPHPMSILKKEVRIEDLKKNNINFDLDPELKLDKYLNLISNWSGIFIEFALVNRKMPYHINTSKKFFSETYFDEYETFEEHATRSITYTLDINNISKINFNDFKNSSVKKMSEEASTINQFYNKFFYNDIQF